MGLMRYSTGAALAALLLAGSAYGQTAPAPAAQQPTAAGAPNPAAGDGPVAARATPQFELADGIVATVNDKIITGYDLRQQMLMLIASSQVQPTEQNLPAIQQAALNRLIEERLKAQEITKFETLKVTDQEIDDGAARGASAGAEDDTAHGDRRATGPTRARRRPKSRSARAAALVQSQRRRPCQSKLLHTFAEFPESTFTGIKRVIIDYQQLQVKLLLICCNLLENIGQRSASKAAGVSAKGTVVRTAATGENPHVLYAMTFVILINAETDIVRPR